MRGPPDSRQPSPCHRNADLIRTLRRPQSRTVSFPGDSNALQAQLEAWTNVTFDFDSPASDDAPLGATSPRTVAGADKPLHHHDAFSQSRVHDYNAGFPTHPDPFAHGDGVDLNAFLANPTASTSLVDPALSLPPFAHAGHALPDAFFVAPGTGPASASAPIDPVTLSPAEISVGSAAASTSSPAAAPNAAPAPARAGRTANAGAKKASGSSGPARKKRASSSQVADKAPVAVPVAPAAAAAPAASVEPVEPLSANDAPSTPASVKSLALTLPEGVDPTSLNDEELNRLAIEEDKRRRNTAASARFRVKKKQREQALEQEAKELRERVAVLEKEVDTLKTENGWLRGIITDKHIE